MTTTTESYETFKALRDKAIAELLELRSQLKASFEEGVEGLRVQFESNHTEVVRKLGELGHQIAKDKKGATPARRRTFSKVSDEALKASLAALLAGGKSVTSAEIFSVCAITRPRLALFLKSNPDFIATTGNKRSTRYSLK
jgi:hypothetical protein